MKLLRDLTRNAHQEYGSRTHENVAFESYLHMEKNLCTPVVTLYACMHVQFAAFTVIARVHEVPLKTVSIPYSVVLHLSLVVTRTKTGFAFVEAPKISAFCNIGLLGQRLQE